MPLIAEAKNPYRKYPVILFVAWTLITLLSCLWGVKLHREEIFNLAEVEARANFNKDLVYRRWAAGHGGVYVSPTEKTPPNPYLSRLEDRDVLTTSGKRLTLVNPAYMTRQVHELGREQYGLLGHITSLTPLNPGNAPDDWEKTALEEFGRGTREVSSVSSIAGESYLRYMHVLVTEKPCLKCHAIQGYKEGDVRGGISVSVPLAPFFSMSIFHIWYIVAAHFFVWLVGLLGIYFGNRHFLAQYDRQRKSEATLSESEFRFRELFRNMSSGVAIYRPVDDGRDFFFTEINEAGLLIGQKKREEVIGKSVQEVFPGVQEMGLFDALRRVSATGNAEQLPLASYKDERLALWTRNYIFRLPTGEVVVIFDNITEQRQAAEDLRRSRDEWEKSFNAIGDIVTIQDRNMRIVRANKAACDFFETSMEQLLGKHCYEVFRGAPVPCPDCPELLTIHDMEQHTEIIRHKKLGKTFYVSSAPMLDEQGNMEYLVHVAKDITEQKRLENDLLQARKMEAIGTLAGGIAHDFNNILSAVLGYAELARDDVDNREKTAEYLGEVITAALRARDLVRQILTFSRKEEQTLDPLEPYLIVKETLKLLRASLPATIEIVEAIDKESGTILADPTRIQQVMVNLCTNALHAMEKEKGLLEVRLRRVILQEADLEGEALAVPGAFIELMVRDTGHGMDDAVKERIFEPYFTTKARGKGTGMGLALVHGIVQGCGGFIRFESELGKGSTFHIYFPAVLDKRAGPEAGMTEESLPTGRERLLVVDDERIIADIHRETLERLGYTVETAESGQEALEKFKAAPGDFDLIITDQTMPLLTGAEMAMEMLKIRPDLPIILCTGYSRVITAKEAGALGIKAFLMKPVSRKDLARIVRTVLDGESCI